jgi:hypothetical protein
VTGQLAASLFKDQAVKPFFFDCLTCGGGTGMLPRDVGNQKPTNSMLSSQTSDGLNCIAAEA